MVYIYRYETDLHLYHSKIHNASLLSKLNLNMSQEPKTVECPSAVVFLDQLGAACSTLIEYFEVDLAERDAKVIPATENLELMDLLAEKIESWKDCNIISGAALQLAESKSGAEFWTKPADFLKDLSAILLYRIDPKLLPPGEHAARLEASRTNVYVRGFKNRESVPGLRQIRDFANGLKPKADQVCTHGGPC